MSGIEQSSFLARNKVAIAVTALASAGAIGAYIYYQQQQSSNGTETSTDSISKKKKKNKKSKKKARDDSSETETLTEEVTKIYPVTTTGLPNLTDDVISNLSDKEKEEWSVALKEDGNNVFKNKKYEDAIEFYTGALKLKVDPVFYSNRSACYAALNKHDEVIKDTTEAIKIKPDYTKCLLRRATSYEVLENYTDAMFDLTALTIYGGFSNKSVETVLERVLKKHSVQIVEENMKSKTYELPSASTISSFFGAFVTESSPENINDESTGADKFLYDAIANLNLNTLEGYENADSLINQAVESYDISSLTADSEAAAKASIALEYGAAFKFLKNNPAAATIDIEKAVSLKPRPRTYVYRALINADKASFAQALSDFDQAIKLDSKCADAYYHLGQFYYLSSDLNKAAENFEKAKLYNPSNVYSHIQLACIAYKLGKIEDAENKFREAKLKFTTAPEVPNYYGEILADRGDIESACKQFDTAARLQAALPVFSVGALPLINKATLISRESLERMDEAEQLLIKACELDPRSELARISLAQIKLQKESVDEAIELFEESSNLARTFDEKVQATSFAEATKMQKRIKTDPILSKKIEELMKQSLA